MTVRYDGYFDEEKEDEVLSMTGHCLVVPGTRFRCEWKDGRLILHRQISVTIAY